MTGHTRTLDELLAGGNAADWQRVRDMITSDQIPPARIAEIRAQYSAFAIWSDQQQAGDPEAS